MADQDDNQASIEAIAQRMFGRPLAASELQAIGVRLAGVPHNLAVLKAWQVVLGPGDPAPVFRVPLARGPARP